MVGHEAIRHNMHRFSRDKVAKLSQKVEIVLPLKKDGLAVVAAIVEMVIMPWLERSLATWHRLVC